MKKLTAILVLFTLTSCGGYETLRTPFNFNGKGVNLFGADAQPTGESNTFEVVVNGTVGMTESQAMNLFDNEGRKVCKGTEFTKQITSSGSAQIREYGVKGLNTNPAMGSTAPSIRGYVTCK